jgi:hypothetical protein
MHAWSNEEGNKRVTMVETIIKLYHVRIDSWNQNLNAGIASNRGRESRGEFSIGTILIAHQVLIL